MLEKNEIKRKKRKEKKRNTFFVSIIYVNINFCDAELLHRD